MRLLRLLAAAPLLLLAGCHSAYLEATVHNGTGQTVGPIELDYPSASFGTQTLAPNQDFHYRFKVLGSGNLKLIYTDTAHVEHDIAGPHLDEGEEGSLTVTIAAGRVDWSPQLLARR